MSVIAKVTGAVVTSVTFDSTTAGVGRYTVTINCNKQNTLERVGFAGQGKNWADAVEAAFANALAYLTSIGS
jgi:hypothetical protein